MNYNEFLDKKSHLSGQYGFKPNNIPDFLFDFQKYLVEWNIMKGRSATFADCGLGKTPMALTFADNVVRQTNKPILIATPLAVSYQFIKEAEKFNLDCARSTDGSIPSGHHVVVTNYERLHYFNPNDFSGIICDESSILKNFEGAIKDQVTIFMRKLPYRLLCTATAAPNDYIELGTSSEALGELGYMDMLSKYFKNEQNTNNPNRLWADGGKWRFKHHAEKVFWKWVCSWARAIRKPSDLGFKDTGFSLPPLQEYTHEIKNSKNLSGLLLPRPAIGLKEEKEEARNHIKERCEKVADIVIPHDRSIIFCNTNAESDLLEKILPDAKQVKGSDSDEYKEETLLQFAQGELPILITKPKIGAFGLNLQNCAHVVFFPSHSYEQRYQGIRRCWRYGQKRTVTVDTIATEGEALVINNLKRKSDAADQMFSALVSYMNESISSDKKQYLTEKVKIPSWIN